MFADICCLIYECRHIANTLQSRSASTDEHKLSAVCVFALGTRLHWLPSGFILLVYLFKRLPMPPCSNYATAHGGISVFEFLSGCCICKQQQLMSSQVITVIICIITNSFNVIADSVLLSFFHHLHAPKFLWRWHLTAGGLRAATVSKVTRLQVHIVQSFWLCRGFLFSLKSI